MAKTARTFADRRDRYVFTLPKTIPAGKVLVHNHVRPTEHLGMRGFRAWLADPEPDDYELEPCPCGWAAWLGQHFRVKRPEPS